MITGNGIKSEWRFTGKLSIAINDNEKFISKPFIPNDKVINECFSYLDSIALQNPTDNAWAGQLIVTRYEKKVDLICTSGCTNIDHERNNKIVVDGNENEIWKKAEPNSTWCFEGNSCIFIPKD